MGQILHVTKCRTAPFATMLAAALLTACAGGLHGPTEADLSEFGEYVYRLDTAQLEHHLNALLVSDTAEWEADRAVRQRYTDTELFADMPLWFTRMGVSDEASLLLEHLRREAPRAGLDSTAFLVPAIAADLDVVQKLAFDSLGLDINEVLTRLEYNLSRAYVRFAAGQRYGFVRPDRLLNTLDQKTGGGGFARLFDYEVQTPNYKETVSRLASDRRMEYLGTSQPDDDVYKQLQERLLQTTDKAERRTLAVNMERCRWQMKRPKKGERTVVVNIPAQQLWAVSPDSVFDMRICCGTTNTKTPLLHSAITHIQVNPDWIITPNIIKNEIAGHAGDSSYFARHRYYITDRTTGDTLNPRKVTADALTSGRLRVGQRGGAGNSLGRIVFRFPNNFSVYLHDTSNRSAFDRARRTLSHGCIRVQKPFDLACFLLPEIDEWTTDRLRISMDMAPETDQGREYLTEHADDKRPLRLLNYHGVSPHVPVFIIYYTAYPNPETGAIESWPDLYGYDSIIERHAPLIE